LPIALSIKHNYPDLIKSSCTTLSAFKRVCNLCGLSADDLRNSEELDFNLKMYENPDNSSYRTVIRNNVIKTIEKRVKDEYYTYLNRIGLDVHVS
jgi:hypothetical protein